MHREHFADRPITRGRFAVKLAATRQEIEAAFRLRFEVFNMELREGLPESCLTGMDQDDYDDYCDHLIIPDCPLEMRRE